jgi:hypothetical protein
MRTRFMTLTILLGIGLAAAFSTEQHRSSAQDPIRKQPACTIFCGDGTFNSFSLGAKPCWGGPLPPDAAGDQFKGLAQEDQAAICRIVAAAPAYPASCPSFKALAQLCKENEPPNDEAKKPKCDVTGWNRLSRSFNKWVAVRVLLGSPRRIQYLSVRS